MNPIASDSYQSNLSVVSLVLTFQLIILIKSDLSISAQKCSHRSKPIQCYIEVFVSFDPLFQI